PCPSFSDMYPTPSFFFLIPPPPSSTLFPYTTLFRSRRDHFVERLALAAAREPGGGAPVAQLGQEHRRAGGIDRAALLARLHLARDRKSTRLNSSHRTISYAVFCLKKKKKQDKQTKQK